MNENAVFIIVCVALLTIIGNLIAGEDSKYSKYTEYGDRSWSGAYEEREY